MNREEQIIEMRELKSYEQHLGELKEKLLMEAKYFCKKNYGLDFDLDITINPRLRTTYGSFRYYLRRINKDIVSIPHSIEMNKNYCLIALYWGSINDIFDVLRHELVHYSLCKLGKDFSDGDEVFEKELAKHNISSSECTDSKKVISKKKLSVLKKCNVYNCNKCKSDAPVRSAKSTVRFFCKNCGSVEKATKTQKIKISREFQ